jgi:hypothetical protein
MLRARKGTSDGFRGVRELTSSTSTYQFIPCEGRAITRARQVLEKLRAIGAEVPGVIAGEVLLSTSSWPAFVMSLARERGAKHC